eukprot:7087348-Prymnesium_polylepis.1
MTLCGDDVASVAASCRDDAALASIGELSRNTRPATPHTPQSWQLTPFLAQIQVRIFTGN